MVFSLILLSISRVLLYNAEKDFKELEEKHLKFILNEKEKVLILNPQSLEFIDFLCNSPFKKEEKKQYLEDLKEFLKDFNFKMSIYCLNQESYEIKTHCEKEEKIESFNFPDYKITLIICDSD